MSQVSSSQVGLCDAILHRQIELIKAEAGHVTHRRCRWDDLCQTGTDQASIGTGEEEGHAPAELGDLVAMRLRDACDQTMQAQTAQVIGHLSLSKLIWGKSQERCE